MPVAVAGASDLHLSADRPTAYLAGHARYYRDPTGAVDVATAAALAHAGRFVPMTGNEVSAGFLPRGALWLHFRVAAGRPGELWWLEAATGFIDHITVHLVAADGTVVRRDGGRAQPFDERELRWHRHGFRMPDDVRGYDVFIRYASAGTLRAAPWIARDDAYESFRYREHMLQGAFFGIMAVVALLSLFRCLRNRSPADGLYALYILSLETANIVLSELSEQLGLTLPLACRHALVVALPIVAGATLLGFVRTAIAWPASRRIDMNAVTVAVALLHIGGGLLAWLHSPSAAFQYANFGTGVVVAIAFTAGIVGAARRVEYAVLFLLGFTPFLLVVATRVLQAFGFLQAAHIDTREYMAAALAHALLLLAVTLIRDAGLARIRRELEWQLNELREVVSNQTLLMRMLAHEVRTPVAVVDTEVQLIERRLPGPVELVERTRRIRASIARLSDVFERFVSQDHLASRRRIEVAPVDLDALIGRAVAEVRNRGDRHRIQLELSGTRRPFAGDAMLIYAAVINLLENAVRYSPDGGTITLRLATRDHDAVVLAVSDPGVGIPPQDCERIFERYYRTGQVKNAVGAGLGLYLVRSIARLHGGDVVCNSRLGHGSTFELTLRSRRG